MGHHDRYVRELLREIAGNRYAERGQSVVVDYPDDRGYIDGVIDDIGVEIEARTPKQVRGAAVDLLLHGSEKKMMVLVPANGAQRAKSQCEVILALGNAKTVVVVLEGSANAPAPARDMEILKEALAQLEGTMQRVPVLPAHPRLDRRTLDGAIREAVEAIENLTIPEDVETRVEGRFEVALLTALADLRDSVNLRFHEHFPDTPARREVDCVIYSSGDGLSRTPLALIEFKIQQASSFEDDLIKLHRLRNQFEPPPLCYVIPFFEWPEREEDLERARHLARQYDPVMLL